MTAEKYLICHECKSYVFACKNGRVFYDKRTRNDLATFIEKHEHECEGPMHVWDESCLPFDDIYKDSYGMGRKD